MYLNELENGISSIRAASQRARPGSAPPFDAATSTAPSVGLPSMLHRPLSSLSSSALLAVQPTSSSSSTSDQNTSV